MLKIKCFSFFILSWSLLLSAQTAGDRFNQQEIDRNRAEQSWLLQGAYPTSDQSQDRNQVPQTYRRQGTYERQRNVPSYQRHPLGHPLGEEFYPPQSPSPSFNREVERSEAEQRWLYQDAYPRSSGRQRD